MATKIATTITTTMRNLLRAHNVRVCVHHNNNGKHSVLVPFETGRRVKTKRTKPSQSEEDTNRARERAWSFFKFSRTEQNRTLPFVKKMRWSAKNKTRSPNTTTHQFMVSRRFLSFSLFLSLSLSLFFFARCCSMRLHPSKLARVFLRKGGKI